MKETYFAFGRWEIRRNAQKDRDEWAFVDMTIESGSAHLFEVPAGWLQRPRASATPAWWKRNSLFMPRLTLEVTDVRVERLKDISEADAIAEGLLRMSDGSAWQVDVVGRHYADNPVDSYASLWESINGAGSWDANQWVWVVEFERLPKLRAMSQPHLDGHTHPRDSPRSSLKESPPLQAEECSTGVRQRPTVVGFKLPAFSPLVHGKAISSRTSAGCDSSSKRRLANLE